MRRSHLALAALLAAGLGGCAASDGPPYYTTYPAEPVVVQPQPAAFPSTGPMIEGQVVRYDGDAYVIQDASGRQTRVLWDRSTVRENVAVGDYVVARFDGPSSAYATSIMRRSMNPAPPMVAALPKSHTIEGIVHRQVGNDYEIKDISGKEYRLHVDNTTKRDGNITVGDRVMAITSTVPADLPYLTNVYRYGNPYAFQGEIVRIDDERYIIRDTMGRETRIRVDDLNRYNSPIKAGDRVVVMTGRIPSESPYYVYKLGDPRFFQGDVVRIDGTCYTIRDLTGRETCLYTNPETVWNDQIVAGDRIIAYTGPPSVHVDQLAKR